MRRRWPIWAALAVVALLAAGGGWYWFHGGRNQSDQPAYGRQASGATPAPGRGGGKVPVEVAEAKNADLPVYLDSLGTVQAYNAVLVRSRVDGELVQIAFQEGQEVKQGDLLAQIDPRPFQAALDQALAKQKQDEATLAANQLDLARTRELNSRAFASQQQLDQQTANVAAQTALVANDQAAVSNARTQLGYATIRAPISGRTGLRLVDRGNIVRASDTNGIVEIAQLQPISVLFTAPEGQLPAIAAAKRAGDVQVIALSSGGNAVLDEGVLALINNSVDAASGTVRLKATFPNASGQLWPGLSVNTRLLSKTLQGVVTIPDTAVLRGQNELFAFVVEGDGKVEKRTLKVGVIAEGSAEVEDGVRVGEKVVIKGQSRLQPGSEIEIKNPGQKDEGGTSSSSGGDRRTEADAAPTKR